MLSFCDSVRLVSKPDREVEEKAAFTVPALAIAAKRRIGIATSLPSARHVDESGQALMADSRDCTLAARGVICYSGRVVVGEPDNAAPTAQRRVFGPPSW